MFPKIHLKVTHTRKKKNNNNKDYSWSLYRFLYYILLKQAGIGVCGNWNETE